ncbi:hypothetical protein DICSQDRAFT_132851 [Dichomitus squalens LYAD-421 SS1]|uniref:uncharacterized protein n=1 Tax=Dichomitus squalens (strain LYAD-421) TaxID=732165 RepID=UPI00044144B3|nr:uncharacterized protein DICSQDRAFT_132851 [Dichomitus squalens LYAD-421 SS1]EJF65285.1 hypothetical protein DICSQDRAFT_132851 [Dichomitus squalens LYAD-421 SS1]
MSFISSSSSSGRRDHRRTRSATVFPSQPSSSSSRAHYHTRPRLSESDVPWRVPPPRPIPELDQYSPTRLPAALPGVHPAPARPNTASAAGDNGTDPLWDVPLFENRQQAETPQQHGRRREPGGREPSPGVVGQIMVSLGYAGADSQARRALVSLVCAELWWLVQFVAVIALLAVSARSRSPTKPGLTEWSACDRPLGAWNALWLAKVVMSASLSYWGWRRTQAHRMRTQRGPARRDSSDSELATQRVLNGRPHYGANAGQGTGPRRAQTGLSYEGTSGANGASTPEPPKSPAHSRLTLLTSFLTLAWFLTAHVLEYTSVNSCRLSSPHLWWLTFALLCTLYLMVLEIFLLGLLVFVLGPVLYIMYNILLLCLGRHPLQNPHYIKPDITKLPKAVVDQIPLVLYIPPPPGEPADSTPSVPVSVTVPAPAHGYPPKSPTPSAGSGAAAAPRRRFMFLRRKDAKGKRKPSRAGPASAKSSPEKEKAEKDVEGAAEDEDDEDVPWDETWEKGEYPFVRLEGNRAVCAICLMDFEEPRRVRGAKGLRSDAGTRAADANANANAESGSSEPHRRGPGAGASAGQEGKSEGKDEEGGGEATQEIQVEAVTEEERDALKLGDGAGGEGEEGDGEGPQPLRLLSCGHVFHKTCLDPWLTDVSGRCPICQRPVEVPQPTKKGKGRRRG